MIKPGTTYNVDENSIINFTGAEFSFMFSVIAGTMNNPEFHNTVMKAGSVIDIVNLYNVLNQKLQLAIQDGIAKESEQ